MVLEKLKEDYETLCKRMKLESNRKKYNTVFGLNPSDDNDSYGIRTIMNKISDMLKKIEDESDQKMKDLYCRECKRSLTEVHKLLDIGGWDDSNISRR